MAFLTNKPPLASKSFADSHGGTGAARPRGLGTTRRSVVFENLLKLAMRGRAGESIEGSGFGKILRSANEPAPSGAGQRTAHADAADTELGCVAYRQAPGRTDQKVHWFRRDRFYDRGDIVALANAGRIQAVGACFGVSCQPPEDRKS